MCIAYVLVMLSYLPYCRYRTQVEDAHQAGLKEEEAIQIAPGLHCLKAEVLEGSFQSFRTFFVHL